MTIGVGDNAPDFELPANGGSRSGLKELQGKLVVLYFNTKDMTPGCTTEAQKFRDLKPAFDEANAVMIGVSKDSVKRHDDFKTKCNLNFTLVSNTDGSLCKDYGIWVKKKLYCRENMGKERATFLIDAKGVIQRVYRKVKAHAEEVLDAIYAALAVLFAHRGI